jgi:hypothetical protein
MCHASRQKNGGDSSSLNIIAICQQNSANDRHLSEDVLFSLHIVYRVECLAQLLSSFGFPV